MGSRGYFIIGIFKLYMPAVMNTAVEYTHYFEDLIANKTYYIT